jgi:hypothetical protein
MAALVLELSRMAAIARALLLAAVSAERANTHRIDDLFQAVQALTDSVASFVSRLNSGLEMLRILLRSAAEPR